MLGVLACVSGFVLMSFEMTAARVLAPTIGSSTYVWTSVIGVIITALSVGYWYGGRLADRRSRMSDCVFILLGTALAVALVSFFHRPVLMALADTGWDVRLQGTLASLVLFAPASFLLGILSPYLARLNIARLDKAGQAVADLSALNAIGGISGTFTTGFFLFSLIGSRRIFIVLAVLLLAASWLAGWSHSHKTKAMHLFSTLGILALVLAPAHADALQVDAIDTASAHYTIGSVRRSGRTIHTLQTGPRGYQSATDMQHPDVLVLPYARELARVASAADMQPKNILILGGGAYSLPGYLAARYPASQIDVVEIDPHLPEIARKHFAYKKSDNTSLIAADARSYINTTDKQYDIIIIDVYSDSSIPAAFITDEFGAGIRRALRPNGIAAANMIAGSHGTCFRLHEALSAPYRTHFPAGAYLLQRPADKLSNIIAVFGGTETVTKLRSSLADYQPYDPAPPAVYSDDFTPIEPLQYACLNG